MNDFVPCLVPPPLPTEEEGGDLSARGSVLLDTTAYISAAAVSNGTTAIGELSTGRRIHVSLCLARPPRLSYLCAHFPGPALPPSGTRYLRSGTPAVRCIKEAPQVISTHADLALLRVPLPGALDLCNPRRHDYFVYTARPGGPFTLDRLPHPHPKGAAFQDNEVAIFRCSSGDGTSSRYIIAGLRNTVDGNKFKLQRYDSHTCVWTSTLLPVHAPVRDDVLPIPSTATELVFHDTTKAVVLGGPRATVGWVDLWRGILFCDVLDKNPVLRDVPLPKPARANRRFFCRGGPHCYREIAVVTLPAGHAEIKYVEMETRPGEDLPPPRQPVDSDDDYSASDDDNDDLRVAPYWKATIWTMPVPIGSWKDWHKDRDCRVDVTDILVDNPRHCDLLLPLPRLSTDPETAAMSLRRLLTCYPTLELDANGELVIYLLSKVDSMYKEGWVIAVGARDKKLRGIAELDIRKNKYFRRYYHHTDISKYLMDSTGEVGALVEDANVERRLRSLVINM
ncbi:unnamed protein product [Urochloa decumbens]|uniref:DUF1618 domain-containing protein n=1 Tax=Urochloa decumbens TaxID=240449 RepID=A0ABC8W8G8_9POAL